MYDVSNLPFLHQAFLIDGPRSDYKQFEYIQMSYKLKFIDLPFYVYSQLLRDSTAVSAAALILNVCLFRLIGFKDVSYSFI